MAATYNITINMNSDFKRSYQLKEDGVIVDLTGYSIAGALKENYRATDKIDFVATITDASQGVFDLSVSDTTTAAMDPGTWVYDVVLTDAQSTKTRLLEGRAFVKQGVTPV